MAAQQSSPRKGHRRRDHVPRHVREEHRIARTAAAGAAGAVVIGAALGLTGGALTSGGPTDGKPTTSALDSYLAERAADAETVSRGLARAELPQPELVGLSTSRGQAPQVRSAPTPVRAAAPLPDVPEDCEEYTGNRALGCSLLGEYGFGMDQMPALDALWTRESGWNHQAYNASSGAYGIPQALPGNKMGSVASDWETNPATQIRWGLGYIRDRYGSPDAAWAHSQANGWY